MEKQVENMKDSQHAKTVEFNYGQKNETNKYLDKRWGSRQTLAVTTYYSTFQCSCSFFTRLYV